VLGLALMAWTWARAASMSGDGAHYMELAERAWLDGPRAGMDWYSGPGYPVATGWVYGLMGDLEFAGRLTSFLFGMATLAGVAILTWRLFGTAVSGVAVGLLAVHTTLVRHAVMAETDVAYACWSVWSILFVWELRHAKNVSRQAVWSVLSALALGAGYLTRPEAVPLAALLGLWYLFARVPPSRHADRNEQQLTPSFTEHDGNHSGSSAGRSIGNVPMRSGIGMRLCWAVVVVTIFLVVAAPYLLRLRLDLGRWSLSGKERAFAMKYAADRQDVEEIQSRGVLRSLLSRPRNLVDWLPHHLHYGLPVFAKSLHVVVLTLAAVALWRRQIVTPAIGSIGILLWTSVPFLIFFGLTYPRPRYFMQSMPQWTILAAVGVMELAGLVADFRVRFGLRWNRASTERGARRAFAIALTAPMLIIAASTVWSHRSPIERSLATERQVGERILELAGPGRRVLCFSVPAFYARADRIPLWGPMEGIVRCHGFAKPLSYDDFVEYVRRHRAEYVVLDHDLRSDCPEFLDRLRADDFELVADDIVDHHGPQFIYRCMPRSVAKPAAN